MISKLLASAVMLISVSLVADADPLAILNTYADSNGGISEAKLKDFLHGYYSSVQPFTVQGDPKTGEILPEKMAKAIADRNTLLQAQADFKLKVLEDPNNPAEIFYLKNRYFRKDDIAHEVLGLNDSAIKHPEPEPPQPTPEEMLAAYKKSEVFFSARKSAGLLDSDFVVDLDPTKKPTLANLPSDSGALLSYNRNFLTDQNTWTAQGSLGLPVRFPMDSKGIQEVWFVPSVDFNHLGGSAIASSKRLDSLAWREGVYVRTYESNDQALQFRAGAVEQTDFRFSSLLVGGESEVEYKNGFLGAPLGIWNDYYHNPRFNITPRLILNLDGGHVLSQGYKAGLVSGSDYGRFGPVASLTFSQGAGLDGLAKNILPNSVRLNYSHYLGYVGRAYDDYGVVGNWKLDDSGVFSISAAYDHGGLNPNGDKADQFTLGLTIKK
jgi:hypothetical protein